MRKLISMLLAVLLLSTCTLVASAEETILTTSVPPASYTLVIPSDTVVSFGSTTTDLEILKVSESSGFAEGKDLKVTISYTPFTSTSNSCKIPYTLKATYTNSKPNSSGAYNTLNQSGQDVFFLGTSDGTVRGRFTYDQEKPEFSATELSVEVTSEDWGKALAGDYSATITFTSEVVSTAS